MSHWTTVEYIGGGFVIQQERSRGGSEKVDYDSEKGGAYCPERVIHINDAPNIDTTTIDMERLISKE